MYSVVLMVAMTTAPEVPNFGLKGGHGCYSSCSGCYGGGYGGCWGSKHHGGPYYGCCGGGLYSCHGCWGGVTVMPYSCHGYGIYGGASYMWPTPYFGGCGGCYGYGFPAPAVVAPPKVIIEEKKEKIDPKKTMAPSPDQARVIVRLPSDAKLYANGHETALTSSERDFVSPTLEQGRDYQYTFKVEYVRNGKTLTDTQVVKVRAGEVSVADFADQTREPSAVSSIKFVLPEGAKVFVDGARQELPAGTTEYKTPALMKGLDYAYQFRAELTKDGKKLDQTQRVVFKGGEPVTVDFSDMAAVRTASK